MVAPVDEAVAPESAPVERPSPADRAARDRRRADRWARRSLVGAAVAVTVPATLFAASTASDLATRQVDDQYVYAQAAFLLGIAGVLAGVMSTIAVVTALGAMDRGTTAFRQGAAALVLIDVGLVWFGLSTLRRLGSTYAPVSGWVQMVSGVAVLCVIAALVLLIWLEPDGHDEAASW